WYNTERKHGGYGMNRLTPRAKLAGALFNSLYIIPQSKVTLTLQSYKTTKRHDNIVLYKKYVAEEFPKYDNYNAINIDKVSEIPMNYNEVMGVPITFIDKYNPKQFELLGIMNTGEKNIGIRYKQTPHGRPLVNGVEKYLRILIRTIKLKK
ncbi:adenine-specific methyltransferase EcoRI family protein, partial [Patescibacteria group bacterium]|nr:adenine-specific methyltransferase EcoRI family protein [Patescibacteria group bacterium]MBU1783467.1 adenine-specific methyltransferase EcoRI family protein [Patescibacteria group bacterium]MBU1991654.1 adenine-specific methyltransferase EcoRI family protein [Patescibacteria group bacterium]